MEDVSEFGKLRIDPFLKPDNGDDGEPEPFEQF